MFAVKEVLKELMSEFLRDGLPEEIVSRDVDYYEAKRSATVVKGMRRTGKTFFTYGRIRELLERGVEPERIIHINFDDDRLKGLRADDLKLIEEAHAELYPQFATASRWYFLDELQDVEGWERYARRLVDCPKAQLCLTGSSSRLLSAEIATEMRGRSAPIEIFPLSFREFLRFNQVFAKIPTGVLTSADRGILRHAMERYLKIGGFPAVQGMPDAIRIATLQEYLHAVLYRDVLQRHEVASVQALSYTLDYLLHNYARKSSVRTISGVLKNLGYPCRREDVADYLAYLKDAYFAYSVPVLSESLAVKRVNPEKYYVIDTGLINATTPKADAEKGWKLENIVYLHLRRGVNRIHYLSLGDNREVDFHVYDPLNERSRLVQVAWDLDDDATAAREITALVEARERTGIADCTIVTWDTERTLAEGIRIVPVWKWLLEDI